MWMIILILVLSILLIVGAIHIDNNTGSTVAPVLMATAGIISAIVFVIMAGIGIVVEVTAPGDQVILEETYTALIFKLENADCRDEFGLLNKEIIDEVESWNKKIRKGQLLHDHPWNGYLYADIYDDFELIDYTRFNTQPIE